MVLESDQDFPNDLLEKLRNLELELEDGDITQKGFEKKKATLLQQYDENQDHRLSSGSGMSNSQDATLASATEVDLGGEPSAADVIDFLDYLPSPTHSPPTHETSGAVLMEQNHRHIQQEAVVSSSSASSTPVSYQQQQYVAAQPQQYYPYQQQPLQQQQWQQQQQQQQQGMYGGGVYYPQAGMGSPRPNRPYDPRMAPRGPAPAPYGNGNSMRQYPPQQQPRYRPAPGAQYPSQPQQQQQRPMYATGGGPPPPQSRPPPPVSGANVSPRPVYRSGTVTPQQPMRPPPPNGGGIGYRPAPPVQQQQQQQVMHGRTSSLSSPRPANYGNYRQAPQPPRNIPPESWRGYQ